MDAHIAARFNEDILQAACRLYEIPAGQIKSLDGFESFIYEFERADGQFILRIGHSERRSPDLIRGEVDWINYLAAHGVTVARGVLARPGNLIELLADGTGGHFLCTAFVKAHGGHATREHFNDRLFLNYGRLLGRMHALAKPYALPNPAWRRFDWDHPVNNTPDRQLPPAEALIREKYQAVYEHLQALPRDSEGYGMIHQDAHLGNMFVDAAYNLTLFDFDDCVYGHFIYDIAMVLLYAALWDKDRMPGFTAHFMPIFLQGYREHNRLDPRWLQELPNFLKLREIDLFAAILSTQGETPEDDWAARFMEGRRPRIENDAPFIAYDWESLAQFL